MTSSEQQLLQDDVFIKRRQFWPVVLDMLRQ